MDEKKNKLKPKKHISMKVKIILLLLLASTFSSWAQPLNVKKLKAYLTENIQQLDPIEGLYDVENIIDIYSNYSGREIHKQHMVCAVIKNPNESEDRTYDFFVNSIEGDVEGLIGFINKTGSPRYYTFNKANGEGNISKIQFQFTNLFSFEFNENNAIGRASSKVTCRFIKKFPTAKMYSEVQNKEKASHPQQSSGSGFFLSQDGYIITNHHVIENARTIKVSGINDDNKTSYTARVEISDKQNDLAILKITDASFKPLANIPYTFKYTTSSVGEDCFVLGYPLISTMGMDIKLTNGIISSKTGYEGNIAEYQMSAPVQPGNSGGPLFDKNGNIIGVVCAKHRDAENASYAIKASYIRNLVELLPTNISMPQTNMLAGKTLPKQVELASKAVCVVIVNDD